MFRGLARAARVNVKNRSMFRLLSGSEMITDTMSMSELRRIVKERQLPISTAGRGRTRDKGLSDIKAALASEAELKPLSLQYMLDRRGEIVARGAYLPTRENTPKTHRPIG